MLPRFEYLKAHNNKVAMELLRERAGYKPIQTIHTKVFGTFEEIKDKTSEFSYPVVIKIAGGSMSKGVSKAENPDELLIAARNISKSSNPRLR